MPCVLCCNETENCVGGAGVGIGGACSVTVLNAGGINESVGAVGAAEVVDDVEEGALPPTIPVGPYTVTVPHTGDSDQQHAKRRVDKVVDNMLPLPQGSVREEKGVKACRGRLRRLNIPCPSLRSAVAKLLMFRRKGGCAGDQGWRRPLYRSRSRICARLYRISVDVLMSSTVLRDGWTSSSRRARLKAVR